MLQNILPKTFHTYAEAQVSPTRGKLPKHLAKFVVEQNYERYTPEDQAVWRFIMRQLKSFLSTHAHPSYIEGLERTGISVERIPHIDEMDKKLGEFGWGAVPVSGFIPPAAFMEFQSLGILPIASDMRSIDHLTYTPAPDIVHEASGHAPMLINSEYAAYLKQYAEVARHAIISQKDIDQYDAIRILSDVKENPESTAEQIAAAEAELTRVNKTLTSISEAGWLSRMNWWTAEYGLIGDPSNPVIYGAGLLSSVGESREFLNSKVRKIPLSLECINTGYDITEPQPQLFITQNFAALHGILQQLSERLAFRLGGITGLQRAIDAANVNTVVLDSGLQISGSLQSFQEVDGEVQFVKFQNGTSLNVNNKQLKDHGTEHHKHGFSSPLGRIETWDTPLSEASDQELNEFGFVRGQLLNLRFASGFDVQGIVVDWIRSDGKVVVIQFKDCTVKHGESIFFEPSWGVFDLAVGEKVVSVFAGPADREAHEGAGAEFVARQVTLRSHSPSALKKFSFYKELREFRETNNVADDAVWLALQQRYLAEMKSEWLPAIELIELIDLKQIQNRQNEVAEIKNHLQNFASNNPTVKTSIEDGLRLANRKL